uniref:Uncharacterized protein n=1 Tax=Anopheles farauti TaxID=69004 RepID=A0A182Q4I0_9DIPT
MYESNRSIGKEDSSTREKTNLLTLKWDKEQFDTRRPYERKNYERPFRKLPGHFATLEGMVAEPRQCITTDTFARRTPVEEVLHKRNVKSVCPADVPRALDDCVEDVIVAENLSSGESVMDKRRWESVEAVKNSRIVSRECYKTFFRARRALFRSDLFQEYFNREPSCSAQEPDTDDSEEDLPDVSELSEEENIGNSCDDREDAPYRVRSSSVGSYEPPTIVHREDKVAVVEAQEQFLARMRSRYLEKFERVREQLENADQERHKPPAPFDPDRYEADYPELDVRNEARARFRKSLRQRLEELNQLQHRPVRKYPTSVKQFAAYKTQLMEDRRKLRDEAELVESYFRNRNIPKELPEAKLEVKRYRLAEFGTQPDDWMYEEGYTLEPSDLSDPPVYHTCMTRHEWSHWTVRSVKIEKLKLPKVKIPHVPVLVQKCTESPIRAYIQGRLDGAQGSNKPPTVKEEDSPQQIIHSMRMSTMRNLLFDPKRVSDAVDYTPYEAILPPYSDMAEERFRRGRARRKGQRQRRKSRMQWIEELVDKICRRKRC